MTRIFCLIILIYGISSSLAAAVLEVRYFQADAKYEYRTKLLELALKKTEQSDGEFKLVPTKTDATQKRGLTFLEEGTIDVVSVPTTKERETTFLPVRIPILKGILGYRVFLIQKSAQSRFNEVKTLEQLTLPI